MLKTVIIQDRLTKEERECVMTYSEIDDKWYVDVSVGRLRTKFIKQGWKQTSVTTLPDGTWVASTFEAPYKSISIRNPEKSGRVLTDEQKKELSERAKVLFSKK